MPLCRVWGGISLKNGGGNSRKRNLFRDHRRLRKQTLSPSTQNWHVLEVCFLGGRLASSFFMGGLVAAPHTPCNQPSGWTEVLVSGFVVGGLVECKCGKILGESLRFFTEWPHKAFATVCQLSEIFDATQISFSIIRVNSCAFVVFTKMSDITLNPTPITLRNHRFPRHIGTTLSPP